MVNFDHISFRKYCDYEHSPSFSVRNYRHDPNNVRLLDKEKQETLKALKI